MLFLSSVSPGELTVGTTYVTFSLLFVSHLVRPRVTATGRGSGREGVFNPFGDSLWVVCNYSVIKTCTTREEDLKFKKFPSLT